MRQTADASLISRAALLQQLQSAVQYPLVSIKAGVGFGKTTFIRQFISRKDRQSIYLLLAPSDNSCEHFWSGIVSAFRETNPVMASDLDLLGFPYTPSKFNMYIRLLTKHLQTGYMYFVYDDFHLIHEPNVLSFIQNTVCAQIGRLRTIVLSQTEDGLDRSLLLGAKLIFEFSQRDFCFTKDEIAQLFRQNGVKLAHGSLDFICCNTEGWPLAVETLCRTMAGGVSLQDAWCFTRREMFETIDKLVYRGYDANTRSILNRLAALENITMGLACHLAGFTSEKMAAFVEGNAFLEGSQYDGTFHVNRLFREFIISVYPLPIPVLSHIRHKAAKWLTENGKYAEALGLFKENGDYTSTWKAVKLLNMKHIDPKSIKLICEVFDQTPHKLIREQPYIRLYAAFSFMSNMELERAYTLLSGLEEDLLARKSDDPLLGETYLLLGLLRYYEASADFPSYFNKAHSLIEGKSQLITKSFPLADINPGFASRTLKSTHVEEMLEAYRSGFPYFIKVTGGCGAGIIELAEAEVYYYSHQFDRAEIYLHQAHAQAKKYGQLDIELNVYFMLFYIHIERGDYEETKRYFDKLLPYASPFEATSYSVADIAAATVYAYTGQYQDCAVWMRDNSSAESTILPLRNGRNASATAYFMLHVHKNHAEALVFILGLVKLMAENHRWFSLSYMYVLACSAYLRLDQDENAWEMLEKAYDVVCEGNYITMLVQYNRETVRLVRAYRKSGRTHIPANWLDKLEQTSAAYVKSQMYIARRFRIAYSIEKAQVLTEKEQQTMELLCRGHSRVTIANELDVSEHTINSRIERIFNKLGASNAIEAAHLYTLQKVAGNENR